MEAGTLDRRLSLQKPAMSRNSAGDNIEAWATYDTVWGNIRPLGGNERLAAQQVQSDISHEITIRYHKHVAPLHRISHRGVIYEINAVLNTGARDKQMTLRCTEQQDGGRI